MICQILITWKWLASVGTSCRPKPLNEKTQAEAVTPRARIRHEGTQEPDNGWATASVPVVPLHLCRATTQEGKLNHVYMCSPCNHISVPL